MHIPGPYHAIQVPVLVLCVPIDVQGQLLRTEGTRSGQGRHTAQRLTPPPNPPRPADPANSCFTHRATSRSQVQVSTGMDGSGVGRA